MITRGPTPISISSVVLVVMRAEYRHRDIANIRMQLTRYRQKRLMVLHLKTALVLPPASYSTARDNVGGVRALAR